MLREEYNVAKSVHIAHRLRNHGCSGGWCPPMFSDSYIARLNFILSDQTALAYRSIVTLSTQPPLPNYLPEYSSVATGKQETVNEAQECNESMKT